MLMTARARSGSVEVTMPRRHTLWPMFPTASSGTVAWTANSSSIMAGGVALSGASSYLEWENTVLSAGNWLARVIYEDYSGGGTCTFSFAGTELGGEGNGTLDTDVSAAVNKVAEIPFTVGSNTRGIFRVDGEAAAVRIKQIELVKTSAGGDTGTSIDDLAWSVDFPLDWPLEAATVSRTRFASTAYSWGFISMANPFGAGGYWDFKVWLPAGTYTFEGLVVGTSTVTDLQLSVNGTPQGSTVDLSPGSANNTPFSTTGITVTTTGLHTIRLSTANGGTAFFHWLRMRKTASVSEPSPVSTAREQILLYPWSVDDESGWNTWTSDSTYVYYGYISAGTTGDYLEWQDFILGEGTYKIQVLGISAASSGVVDVRLDASSVGSVTLNSVNGVKTVSGVTVSTTGAHDLRLAYSSGSDCYIQAVRIVRTGD